MGLRLAAGAAALCLVAASAVPALAAAGLGGHWSGSVRTEAGIVSAVVDVQPQEIGKTAGSLAFRGPNEWDCNVWLEYAGSVDSVHAYLPRRKNDEDQTAEKACQATDGYVEIGGAAMTLRWFKAGQVQVEIPLTGGK